MEYEDELEYARARRERQRRDDARKNSRQGGSKGGRNSGSQYSRRRRKKKNRLKMILIEILVLLALLLFAAYMFISGKFNLMGKVDFDEGKVVNNNLSAEQLAAMKGYWNIACFGVDSRDMKLGAGNNSDVNLICSINKKTGEIKLVSIFRDTYLNISEKDSYNKINAAYSVGGPTQAVAALNKNLGLNISDYATFNWKAVADAINILGGIDVEISDPEFYYINAFITETVEKTGVYSTHLEHGGMNHLDGVQAVAYGRLRLMDTDYARTERQRIVISKAFEKAKSADWATINNIIETVLPQVATSVEASDIIPLAWDIKKYHLGETSGFPTARGEVKKIGKVTDPVVPQTLESNVISLHQFLFGEENYKVPDNVKAISDHIAEASGLTEAGKEIGHVPTDKGVIPKKKSQGGQAAPPETEAVAETAEETSEEETTAEETTAEETQETSAEETKEYGPGMSETTAPAKPAESSVADSKPAESSSASAKPDGSGGPGSEAAPSTEAPEKTTEAAVPENGGQAEQTEAGPGM